MAKIIQILQRKADWWVGQEAYCGQCGCRFALEASDQVTPSPFGPHYLFQVTCPNCKAPAIFSRPDWC